MADLPDDLERLQAIAANLRHRLARVEARIGRILAAAPNRCKLTECQGKPRCRPCLAMDVAHGVNPCRAEQRGPNEWVCDCSQMRPDCKPNAGVLMARPERLLHDPYGVAAVDGSRQE